ncbi:MAG: CNNM domain-containing protein [Phycisphaerales bacterium]|jgi:CBS domain containing-hemolysin-like protein|nr:CNNM domain-containing protein [Phycisphaerales bacterium]
MPDLYIAIGVAVLGLLLSALYSGLETGIYTINQIRLDVRATSKLSSAVRLLRLVDNPTRILAVLLVCNNIANYLASYGAARILEETSLGPWMAILVNAAVMIPLLFIFGEVLPKDLFRTHSDSWTYRFGVALSISDKLLWWTGVVPLVSCLGQLARKILGTESSIEPSPRRRFGLLFKEGLEGGVLSDEQITLADRVLGMRSLTVRSEMVPWQRVSCIGLTTSTALRSLSLSNANHTRLPVINENGNVCGVLPVISALLNPEKQTSELINKPMFIEADTPVREALHKLRISNKSIAIVTSNSNKPIGVVTLKDLVEPIVGELGAW